MYVTAFVIYYLKLALCVFSVHGPFCQHVSLSNFRLNRPYIVNALNKVLHPK